MKRVKCSTSVAEQALAAAAPKVDASTCVTRWCGEQCDYDMAITALMSRDEPVGEEHRDL